MLKKISSLSLRSKFMLAPALGIVFTFILAVLFIATITDEKKTLTNILEVTIESSRSLTHLTSRLATNHTHVYQLLKYAAEDGDEAELYDMGKPLLNEVHNIEFDTKMAIQNIPSTEAVLQTLTEYRKKIITAVEMSTVDLTLAYKFMTLATNEFNKTNSAFLKLNEDMQMNLKNQLHKFHLSADTTLQQYFLLFIVIILVVIIVSYLLSKLLSHDLQQSINTLSKLTRNEDTSKNNSELSQLSQVIAHVKENYKNLKTTREALKQQESQLRSILDNMSDGVITINEKGIILTFNKAAEKMFLYATDEIIGHNVKEIMSNANTENHDDDFLQHNLQKNISIGQEVTAQRKNKQVFPMLLAITELPKKIENKRCFIASCKDITISKQQEQQLRRSQKMDALGKLTGGIAHDYNNMLGIILGYSDLLSASLTNQPEEINNLEKITHAAQRGVKLTSKLMSFSRLKQNDAKKVELNSFLNDQQHMLEKTLTVRIKLTLDLGANIWPIKVDAGDLEDAVLNMCINAMHAIGNTGQLTLQTHNFTVSKELISIIELQPGDYTLLSISDTGCGMNEETLSKIFDPFYSTKGDRGTGLGLSQVYGFMERSKGAIKVYSELGHGTRFALYFPRLLEKPHNIDSEVASANINLNGHETILIVDDEPELLNLCAGLLAQYGYKTYKANNALQALEIIEHNEIDLLFSDVIMPDMDGFQLSLLVQKKYPKIKIQLTSGFSDNRHLNSNDIVLHENLINKPYDSQTLLIKIRQLLDT